MRRQHVQLVAVNSERDKDNSNNGGGSDSVADQSLPQRGAPHRSSGRGFVVNSFEHRHRAQQQLLEQQQQQLAQQRRLIDEMAALQRQQLLQQRLAGPQQLQQQQLQASGANTNGQFQPTHLHAAVASIQRDVLQDVGALSIDHTTAENISR